MALVTCEIAEIINCNYLRSNHIHLECITFICRIFMNVIRLVY